MNRKLGLLCGAALIAAAPLCARADDATMTMPAADTATVTVPTSQTAVVNTGTGQIITTPTQVTGTVLRYYVSRSGYVTAMDVQTADGVQMVRFSPSMGQRLYTTYPVGGTASVYVMGGQNMGMNVVGMGATAPMMTSMPAMMSDVELLSSEPYIRTGAKLMTMSGNLTDVIVGDTGEVIGLVLDKMTLVRVPREVRNMAPGAAGTDRVTPLFMGAKVEVTGYPEMPRYGVLSAFTNRIVTQALVVNGRAVGAIGVPTMSKVQTMSLLKNVNLGGGTRTPEEVRAMGMGYTVYSPSNSTMMNGTMMDSNMNSSSTSTNMSSGTAGDAPMK